MTTYTVEAQRQAYAQALGKRHSVDYVTASEISRYGDADLINAHVIATLAVIEGRDYVMTSPDYPGAHRYAMIMVGDEQEIVNVVAALEERLEARSFQACDTCALYAGRHHLVELHDGPQASH